MPGRPRSIDRDRLLDAAEEIVRREGAAALTIDAVAKAMGVTKGGVQYAFGTKDALVQAIFDRWDETYASAMGAIVAPGADPLEHIRGHVEVTRRSDADDNAKCAAILAALMRSPDTLKHPRRWYRERIEGLDLSDPAARRARLAFLATEGAFMLRFFGLLEMDESEWHDMFADIETLLPDKIEGES